MGLLDTMKGMLAQYSAGTASESNAEADFHQMAQSIDSGTLAQGISAVMRSDQTPPSRRLCPNCSQADREIRRPRC